MLKCKQMLACYVNIYENDKFHAQFSWAWKKFPDKLSNFMPSLVEHEKSFPGKLTCGTNIWFFL